jgi:NADPH-dependent 2,4-dienoyl-CoA reductase/sulfur reductase-like enzyme
MGVHSNTELAKDAGLTVNKGIVVDNHLRTSDPCIYAAGDCAEFQGIVWGIIPAALEQAPLAAKSILAAAGCIPVSAAPEYVQTVPKTALKVADIELLSLGKAVLTPEEAASSMFTVKSRASEDGSRYEKYVLAPADSGGSSPTLSVPEGIDPRGRTMKLAGAILYGSKKNQTVVQKMMGSPVAASDIEALLAGWL